MNLLDITDIKVVADGVLEWRTPEPILAIDIGFVFQQIFHTFDMPFARGKVQSGPTIIVCLIH